MTAIDVYQRGDMAIPEGARPLGIRTKPQLRLAMGYRDETRRGAPVKTDHFIAKVGSERENEAAAKKFHTVYGPQPKSVDILLPAELHQALTIQYKAWGSSGDESGGVLKAIGHTNFALEDYSGGPDVLTVWQQDGTVQELEISGLDDENAKALGVELYTTFRFGLPRVLGFGSFCEVTSKGKETTDTLWQKLRGYYSIFGSKVTVALQPKLVIRPSTARPVIENKEGEKQRIKSKIYVLDVVVPEAMEETFDRLRDRAALLPGGSPAAALYGPRALETATPASGTAPAGNGAAQPVATQQAGEAAALSPEETPAAASSVPGESEFDGEEPGAHEPPPNETAEATFNSGRYVGKTIVEVYSEGKEGISYLKWSAANWKSQPMKTALSEFAATHPEIQ